MTEEFEVPQKVVNLGAKRTAKRAVSGEEEEQRSSIKTRSEEHNV